MNNDFFVLSEVFHQWFLQVMQYKSISFGIRLLSDQKSCYS